MVPNPKEPAEPEGGIYRQRLPGFIRWPIRFLVAPFLLVRRIKYLVDQGVNIKSIAAVAFNVKMAETLRGRFLQLMPEDWNGRQHVDRNISTIHAMCYRMLKDSGDKRRVPERQYWQIKKLIQEFAEKCFPSVEDQPNHQEILGWIYTSKNQGIPIDDVSGFYHKAMEYRYASFMCEMHVVYDKFMRDNSWLMFGDMLYDVENDVVDVDYQFTSLRKFFDDKVDEVIRVGKQTRVSETERDLRRAQRQHGRLRAHQIR